MVSVSDEFLRFLSVEGLKDVVVCFLSCYGKSLNLAIHILEQIYLGGGCGCLNVSPCDYQGQAINVHEQRSPNCQKSR